MAYNPFASDQFLKAGRFTFATLGSNPIAPYPNAIYEPSTLTPAMTIIAGNVGIGTAIPLQGVHIARRTAFTANIGVGTTNPQLPIDIWNTSAIRIPSGTVNERPITPLAGTVRYNTTTQQFEGYGPGGQWGSLGGVKSVDGATYITAELTPGANDSNIRLYTANQIRVFVDANGNVGIGTTQPTEKLLIEGNLYAKGTVYASNLRILGEYTTIQTTTSNTDQLIIVNDGTGPALQVTQTGPQPVAQFVDAESGVALHIAGDGNLGIGTVVPLQRLDVRGTSIFSQSVGFGTTTPRAPIDLYNDVTVKFGANVGIGTITNSRFQLVEALYEYPPVGGVGSITSNVFTIQNQTNGNGTYIIRTSSVDTGFQGYYAFTKSSGWAGQVWLSSNVSMPAYLDITLPFPIQLKRYSITNGNSGSGLGISTGPKTWYLQASTDGINYQTLHVQTNVLWASENLTQTFHVSGVVYRYRYYRITIIESYTPTQTHIGEWRLYGYETNNYALFNDIYVGIGTTTPRAELDVEGASFIKNLTTSNLTILGSTFVGQDNPTLRSRLQIAPINALVQVPQEGDTQFTFLAPGLWKFDPSKTQVYLNGTKLAYYSSNLRDYDVTYQSSGTESTNITVTLDSPAKYGDILDITFWPSYLDENALMQPGYMLQNIHYSQWSNVSSPYGSNNIYYMGGNVGVGTTMPQYGLHVMNDMYLEGTAFTSNLYGQGATLGQLLITGVPTGPVWTPSIDSIAALQVIQSGSYSIAEFYDDNADLAFKIANGGNVGVGTITPMSRLAVEGSISSTKQLQFLHETTHSPQGSISNISATGELRTTAATSASWYTSSGVPTERLRLDATGNLGIGTSLPTQSLHVEGGVYISSNLTVKGLVTTSNLIILGETFTLNTTTSNTDQLTIKNDGSGPALTVVQTGAEAVAQFIDQESGTALFIANTGKVGLGTTVPNVALNVYSTDALRIPVGSEAQKPSGQLGYVRYNTTTQQFEGYGAGNTWGSLGGVKSVDGTTYITAESTPGAGDSNLRFYTSATQQIILNSKGNLGIGTTTVPTKLYVSGDATITGTITASNLNVINRQFYNNDTVAFQTRLQVAPIQYQYINEFNNTTSTSFQIEGLWKVEPIKTQVFINGIKQVYVNSNLKDYDTNYVHVGSNTQVTVYFDTAINSQDIVDLTVWPSYLASNSLIEPGFAIQNIYYTIWNSNASTRNLTYVDGNVGIGTILPSHKLTVKGDILADGTVYASNMVVLGATTILDTLTSNTERLVVQNSGSGPALQVTQTGPQPVADFYDDNVLAMRIADGANVGIGTSLPKYRLDVNGTTLVQQLNIVRASDQSSNSLTVQSTGDELRVGSTVSGLFINDTRIFMDGKVGVGTTAPVPYARLHVQDNLYVSSNITATGTITASNITASNLVILGDTVILQTTTCNTEVLYVYNTGTGPALQVTQTGSQPIAQFVDAETGVGLYIADQGKLGIGTAVPLTTLDIQSTDALRIPVGTEAQKPSGRPGYIRYNTSTQQYEGYGAGNTWGSLGGVKSVDGATFITAELTPGAGDSNLRLYTAGKQQAIFNAVGNLGIGTTVIPTKLYVSGDATITGTITASNLNVINKQFYNNDNTVFQSRLQTAPINIQYINTINGSTSNVFLVEGLWKFESPKTQVFLNGVKLVYVSSNEKDFNVSYTHLTSNTQVSVQFDTPLNSQDIVDITVWPSYIDNNALLQPGFTLQNIQYMVSNLDLSVWSCNTLTGHTFYNGGNVGIGTSTPNTTLDVRGSIQGISLRSTTIETSNATLFGYLHAYNESSNTALRITQKIPNYSIAEFYNANQESVLQISSNANIGIGVSQPSVKLDVMGTVRAQEYQLTSSAGIRWMGDSNFAFANYSQSNDARYTWSFGAIEKMRVKKDGNVGIGTDAPLAKLHVQGDIVTTGNVTASNLTILGDTVILNTVTSNTEQLIIQNTGSGPALRVTQSGSEPIAHFIDAETGTALYIADGGYVGIGTTLLEVPFAVESTSAIRIPAGTVSERPILSRRGQVRYNTTTQQFEGYGPGNQWGPLGGVKSVDGLTYVSAESTPGSGDCNLRFYTSGLQQGIVNPVGNLGIGTTTPRAKLHVEGDMIMNGLFTVSNVNITGNAFSNAYNNDSVAFRSRLQINPTRHVETVQNGPKNTFTLTISGMYTVYPQNVEVYINGTKYAYVSSALHDYTCSSVIVGTNTLLTVTLDENIYGGDVIEITAWPSYINDSMGMQPGFVVQNIHVINPYNRSVLAQPMIQPLQPAPRRYTYDITSNQTVFTETIQALLDFVPSRTEVYLSGTRLLYTPTFQDFNVTYTQSYTTTTVTLTLTYPATNGDILEVYYYANPISTDFGSNFSGVIYQDFTYFQKGDGTNSNIVYPYGNLGIGTTYALNPLHVRGNITFDGLMYDETGKAIWIPGSMVEWKSCTYPNPALVAPGTGVFTIGTRKAQFKYMGNELIYQFRVDGTVTTKPLVPSTNYTLSLEYGIDGSFYNSETILGDAWVTITSGGTKTTYKAYLQTVLGNTSVVSVRYINGTFDNSLSELNVGTSIVLQGTILYKTAYMSTEQGIPKSYLPNSFVQNTLGYTGLNNGGVPARARMDVIESGGVGSCNLPVMILDQRGSNDSIFEIRSNAGEIRLIVNRYGNVGIGTSIPSEKVVVDGTVKATSFVGDGSQLTGLGGYSIWSILNSSNISYSNHVLLGNQAQLSRSPNVLNIVDTRNATARIWSYCNIGTNDIIPSIEWIRGNQATPASSGNAWWDTYIASDNTWRIRNRTGGILNDVAIFDTSNLLVQGSMNVGSNLTLGGTLYASNLQILGDFVTLNTVTSNTEQMVIVNSGSGPALRVVQTGAQAVAEFYDNESGASLFIANNGKVGFGTQNPQVTIDIQSTDALRLPTGTIGQRPTPQKGYIRYNIDLDQFEGYGTGNTWGSLGGVKSVDGLTYITSEVTPGAGDCNIRFYTGGIQRMFVGSNGNVGIGTTIAPSKFYVQGDAIITGMLTTSNINIVGKDFFYNNDSTAFRSRIQLAPYNIKVTVPYNNYITHAVTVEGLWKFESEKSQIYLNGLKLAYFNSNIKDYTISSSNAGLNTDVLITFESGSIMTGDVLDMVLWPSYINDTVTMQPGFMIQNIQYSDWTCNVSTKDITFTIANVGIGTQTPLEKLHVIGNILTTGTLFASNLSILGNTTILDTITSNTERLVIQNAGTGPALQVKQSGNESVADFYDDTTLALRVANGGNIGIGTFIPLQKLHIEDGLVRVQSATTYASNVLSVDVRGVHPSIGIQQVNASNQHMYITNMGTSTSMRVGGASQGMKFEISAGTIGGPGEQSYTPVMTLMPTGNVGIGTLQPTRTLHVEGDILAQGTLIASNIVVLGDYTTLNTVTSNTEQLVITNDGTGPAFQVTQTGNQPIAKFYDKESGLALILADTGKIGIGTENPITTLDIASTDAILLPKGTIQQRPSPAQAGMIRYNTSQNQYEGYTLGSWGSLGGVKSVDGSTYITPELTPGAGDSNLRFYTGGIPRMFIGSNGNVGIGTTTTISSAKLHVYGNTYVDGLLTASNLNIIGETFYNNDSTIVRSRLQLSPYNVHFTVPYNDYMTYPIRVEGLWKFEPDKVEVYLNGLKLAYFDSNVKDYSVMSSNSGLNTDVVISFEQGITMAGDVLDMVLWPSYVNDEVSMQPGFMLQYLNYSPWTYNPPTNNILYTSNASVGIGTSLPVTQLHVKGTVQADNFVVQKENKTYNVATLDDTIAYALIFGG